MSSTPRSEVIERAKRVAQQVLDILRHRRCVILEAYPGFGKTFVGLEVLKNFRRGLYVVRTVAEALQTVRTGQTMEIKLIPVYGRQHVCYRIPDAKSVPFYEFYRLCKIYRDLGRCKEVVTREDIAWLAATPREPREIVEREKKQHYCLYAALLTLAKNTRYVATTYEFVLYHMESPVVTDRDVAILDECHTILDVLRELTQILDLASLYTMVEPLKEVDPRAYYALRTAIKKSSSVREAIEKLSEIITYIDVHHPVLDEIERLANLYRQGRATIVDDNLVLPPSKPRFDLWNRVLMMSAYIPPFLETVREYEIVRVTEGAPEIPTIVDTSITTRYEERTPETPYELAKKVVEYVDPNAANLAVFPSKEFASIAKEVISKHFTTLEPKDVVEAGPGTVVIDVAGGIATEGLNPSKYLRRVIIAGMPYPPPEPQLVALARVFGFEAVFTYLALLKTVQAIGRLTRWGGTAVLIDRRFRDYIHRLPSWIKIVDVY